MPDDEQLNAPAIGWAVSGPVSQLRFSNARWARTSFILAVSLLNIAFLCALGAAIAQYASHASNRAIVLSTTIWGGIGLNVALIGIGIAARFGLRRFGSQGSNTP